MLAALLAASAFAAQPAPVRECGTTTLYGKTLTAVLVWFRSASGSRGSGRRTSRRCDNPCKEAVVTRRAWREAKRASGDPFPTRRQVLADDLMRCGQLDGMTRRAVRSLLGRGQTWRSGGSEYLVLRFGRNGVLDEIEMVQG